jgi:nickel-dependent lactate racemase
LNVKLPYGKNYQELEISENYNVDIIAPSDVPAAPDPLEIVRQAILSSLGSSLLDYAEARSVAIAVNDKTRPVPHQLLLPPLLQELQRIGIPSKAIRLFIATGTHQPMPSNEFPSILPLEIIEKYAIVSHNCDDLNNLVELGTTTYGTLVLVNKLFYQSDLRIVVGDIEPHHFAGFSGGVKSAAIGLTGRDTINHNHAMLVDKNSVIGEYDHNPLRQDIEQIGKIIGIHFAVNAVLNSTKQIVNAYAGDPAAVMRVGIPEARNICQIYVPHLYDLVIASVGGYPKDINFYQSQKALTHSALLTKESGTIILVAACPEGSGSQSYESFMQDIHTFPEVFEKFKREGFRVGPHKAFQVAREGVRIHIVLVSEMNAKMVSSLLLEPANNLQEAFAKVQAGLSPESQIAVMPRATNTIPIIRTN